MNISYTAIREMQGRALFRFPNIIKTREAPASERSAPFFSQFFVLARRDPDYLPCDIDIVTFQRGTLRPAPQLARGNIHSFFRNRLINRVGVSKVKPPLPLWCFSPFRCALRSDLAGNFFFKISNTIFHLGVLHTAKLAFN